MPKRRQGKKRKGFEIGSPKGGTARTKKGNRSGKGSVSPEAFRRKTHKPNKSSTIGGLFKR